MESLTLDCSGICKQLGPLGQRLCSRATRRSLNVLQNLMADAPVILGALRVRLGLLLEFLIDHDCLSGRLGVLEGLRLWSCLLLVRFALGNLLLRRSKPYMPLDSPYNSSVLFRLCQHAARASASAACRPCIRFRVSSLGV